MKSQREDLKAVRTFPELTEYLRHELNWPIESTDFEDLTFDYEPHELGIDAEAAAKIQQIKQLRPLSASQPWGIFFIKFEPKRLPVVVLRRILGQLVIKKRASARKSEQAAWQLNDLLFISNYGEGDHRQITFAHFTQDENTGVLPTLRVLGWDDADTALHLDHTHETLKIKLSWPAKPGDLKSWREQWASAFILRHREVITTSQDLARRLADLARSIRLRASQVLAVETKDGPLRKLYKAFQEALIHDLSEDDFTDMYSQTIAYGLLAARVSRPMGIVADNVADMVPVTNPFLREMLSTFLTVGGRRAKIDFDELGVQEVVDLLNSTDTHMDAVLRDFGNRTRQEDPVIHFYELFLAEYDKKKKVQRGVFYTPLPVVSYIVRSVHELLQTEFGLEDGLADTTTWGVMAKRNPHIKLPDGVKPDDPFVQVLDPATGTATFLVEVIDIIHKTMAAKWLKQGHMALQIGELWNGYVPKHLLPRLYGFELLMAPYSIAHMKLGLKLYETGYKFQSEERLNVYLTNSLEPAADYNQKRVFAEWAPALAEEANTVNLIKNSKRFTVLIGNPPYSNFGQLNRIPFIRNMLQDYKRGLDEKKLNLDDDYIKFLRLSQSLLESAGIGILGFITNNTYFDGITHRQMRLAIRETMSKVFVLDLHGSAVKRERCPDDSKDENVFDIQQGVGISYWIRNKGNNSLAVVRHSELWGLRDQKYSWLQKQVLDSNMFEMLNPTKPYQFFVPKTFDLDEEYKTGVSLTEMFRVTGAGIQTDRDDLFVDPTYDELKDRMQVFFSAAGIADPFRTQYRVEDSSSYPIISRRTSANFDEKCIDSCLYRPFDVRWLYYSVGLTSRPAWDVMCHMLPQHSIGLIAMRQYEYEVPDYCYFFVTRGLTERRVFVSNRGAANCFPLYLVQDSKSNQVKLLKHTGRYHNYQRSFIEQLAVRLKLPVVGDPPLPTEITADSIFHYAYALFHSPCYRNRYAEFLKIDFPRLPLTEDRELFHTLTRLGSNLVALHLLEFKATEKYLGKWVGRTPSSPVEKIAYSNQTVWINKQKSEGFKGVSEEVWGFHIGGYQVCEKWLKDRKGQCLSEDDIAYYQKVIVALSETIRIMAEIDKVIDEHGGWPGAFAVKS